MYVTVKSATAAAKIVFNIASMASNSRYSTVQDTVQNSQYSTEQLQVQDQGGAALLRGHRHPRPRRLRHLQRRHLGLHHLLQQRQRSRRGEVFYIILPVSFSVSNVANN